MRHCKNAEGTADEKRSQRNCSTNSSLSLHSLGGRETNMTIGVDINFSFGNIWSNLTLVFLGLGLFHSSSLSLHGKYLDVLI